MDLAGEAQGWTILGLETGLVGATGTGSWVLEVINGLGDSGERGADSLELTGEDKLRGTERVFS